MYTVDYETFAIQSRPEYPPKPVGVAIKHNDGPAKYYAWGHPTGNNCTEAEGRAALTKAWMSGEEILAHNMQFEMDISETHFKLPRLPWHLTQDSMFLLFLNDPHGELSLKPASERLLDLPPDEQDAVAAWLRAHGVITAKQKPGAFIAQAPGDVVAPYACGDVDRTRALFDLLMPKIEAAGMGPAYDRERKLLPILLDNARQGIRVDVPRLKRDLTAYERSLSAVEKWIRFTLHAEGLNLDADAEVADALDRAGLVTEWVRTPTGRRSTAKKNVEINNPRVALAIDYRNRLQNVMAQSMRPWLIQATHNGGYIFTDWNQVRTRGAGGDAGTRTGRLSCARFMNIAKAFSTGTPEFAGERVKPLPLVRRYLLPDEGHVWIHRDYSQQEYRLLAHMEDGALLETYRGQPRIDFHSMMQEKIKAAVGMDISRQTAKVLNFGILYGMGVGKLSEALKVDTATGTRLKQAQRAAAPGVQALDRELKRRARDGEPIRTWGGRLYFCEPPDEEGRTFDYRLLNYLIQGSAADVTKEALIRYSETAEAGRLLVTVHDEANVSAPIKKADREDEILKAAMESIETDVPMLTDPKRGKSWGEIK